MRVFVRILLTALAIGVGLAAWVGVMLFAAIAGWGSRQLTRSEDPRAFFEAAAAGIEASHKGNFALVVIEDGAVAGERFGSPGRPVGADTLFQVASVSKWVAAWGVMTLVEDGLVDLDAPVSRYLTRWSLPESAFDNDGVTVRRLLSHSAGLIDDFGYLGFENPDEVQTLEDSLTHAADGRPGSAGVRVGQEPGAGWRYSGGGYTMLQLLIEEVTGRSYNDYMRERVLAPLGMSGSGYVLDPDDEPRFAEIYASGGSFAPHYRFTALAAASLYTSAEDLTRFVQAHRPGEDGAPAGRGVLRPETLAAMREPQIATGHGAQQWGLGAAMLPNGAGGWVIGHDGGNRPAISTAVRVDPSAGDGLVVLVTGDLFLAPFVAGQWHEWRTGERDLGLVTGVLFQRAPLILGGAALIVVAGVLGGVFVGRRKRTA